MAQATAPAFTGNVEEQGLAQRVFELMTRSYGSLFARDALIRQSLANLSAYLAEREGVPVDELRRRIDEVVKANPDIFAREERDGDVMIATSRNGAPVARRPDTLHTFRDRLYEPEHPLPVDDISNIVTTTRQVIPAPEPVLISPFWLGIRREPAPTVETPDEPVVQPELEAPAADLAVEEAPVAEVVAPRTSITLRDGTTVDLALPVEELLAQYGSTLQAELGAALDGDPLRRVVSFGDRYYPADDLPTFGKNDLRRIREFIVEQGEPIPDTTIVNDLYRERPGTPRFESFRFGLDYRLLRERDFEFVGMPGANLWSAKGLPAIGGKRVKASDLSQLYAFLPDGYDDSAGDAGSDMYLHTLTFFEWEYGILPLDAALAALLPGPLLDEQRTAVIRVESGQHYTPYLCEIRFPTSARGGWLWGLEEFFHEYLVPGAEIMLAPTEEVNVFTLTYEEAPATEARLLHLEEKRNRFVFMPVTYYAAVDEALLPTQARYNKLRNLKVLPMSERKKTDVVLAHIFETVGEQLGSREEPLYWIAFDELHLAINVLRPMSRSLLMQLLSSNDAFYADETTIGAWYYKPAPEEIAEEAEEEEDDAILLYDEDDE